MLGIEIIRDRKNRKLFISQHQYITEILKRFNMNESRTVSTPMEKSSLAELDTNDEKAPENTPYRQAIGSLIYLVSGTRPDLAFCVRRLSQYLENPQKNHWTAGRNTRILILITRLPSKTLLLSSQQRMKKISFACSQTIQSTQRIQSSLRNLRTGTLILVVVII